MTRAVEARSKSAPSSRSERAAARALPAFIAGARECFDRSGYVGTRIEDIAAAANYAVGSFYTYFSSKEEVLLAASRTAETAMPFELRPGATGAPELSAIIERLDLRCGDRLGLDVAMEQAALRSPSVLVEWRLGRARAVSSLSDALRSVHESSSLSDDELAAVASAVLSMSEQSRRLELDVESAAKIDLWAAALGADAVEATPLTASIDRRSEPEPPGATGSKARLLAAVLRLLSSESWDSVSVARIAESAGLANGTFYRHFDSKAGALAGLVDAFPSLMFPSVSMGASLSFPDEVFHLVIRHMDAVRRSAGLWASVAEAVGDEPLVRDAVDRARGGWVSSVGQALLDRQRSGEVAVGVDVAKVTPPLAAMLEREAFLVAVVSKSPELLYESAATVRDCWWRILTAR